MLHCIVIAFYITLIHCTAFYNANVVVMFRWLERPGSKIKSRAVAGRLEQATLGLNSFFLAE